MIDIAILRENPTLVKENMKKKFQDDKIGLVDEAYKLDKDCLLYTSLLVLQMLNQLIFHLTFPR